MLAGATLVHFYFRPDLAIPEEAPLRKIRDPSKSMVSFEFPTNAPGAAAPDIAVADLPIKKEPNANA